MLAEVSVVEQRYLGCPEGVGFGGEDLGRGCALAWYASKPRCYESDSLLSSSGSSSASLATSTGVSSEPVVDT